MPATNYTITFDPKADPTVVRRIIYWAELLLTDPTARHHMAEFATLPASFRLPTAKETNRLIALATDEEIDDFGE